MRIVENVLGAEQLAPSLRVVRVLVQMLASRRDLPFGFLFLEHLGPAKHDDGRVDPLFLEHDFWLEQFELESQRPQVGPADEIGIEISQAIARASQNRVNSSLVGILRHRHFLTS
ncbi:MAG: hypothetical protein R3B96_15955 [Pirellulaceae bacterium]